MDLKNQGNDPNTSPNPNIPFKKKRGRPRKDQTQNLSRIANLLTMRDQIQGHGDYAQAPPGFARVNESHSHQENPVQHNDDAMVGQTVNGVIEATFDAGYFLSVRIGNSDTSLRGVVFKPGHYLPVSVGNDLTPHFQMISRNVGPTPLHGSYNIGRGRGRGRPRKDSRLTYSENESSPGNQLVTLLGDRGNLVPVVLEPANLSNGVAPTIETPPAVSQPAHLAARRGKSVNQTQLKQLEKDLEKDNGPAALKLPVSVMEDLVIDAVKKIEGSSQSKETQNESGKLSGAIANEQMQDLNEPFLVNPLQAIISDPFNQFSAVPLNFRDAKPGKMTELLLAVQKNVIGKKASDVQHHGFSQYQHLTDYNK